MNTITNKQQVGEGQGDRVRFEAWAKDAKLDVSRSTFNPDGYKQEPTRFAWYAWQAAIDDLRLMIGSNSAKVKE